jgi:antitoxin (DNA-binding transcriptional repressor) of toxin-antitoxin stability system
MESMTLREIRDTKRLKAKLKAGTAIELKERNELLAHIVPIRRTAAKKDWPDFEARLKSIFGDRVLNAVDEFVEDRNRERW